MKMYYYQWFSRKKILNCIFDNFAVNNYFLPAIYGLKFFYLIYFLVTFVLTCKDKNNTSNLQVGVGKNKL